jgi:hypothetical protein
LDAEAISHGAREEISSHIVFCDNSESDGLEGRLSGELGLSCSDSGERGSSRHDFNHRWL